MINTSHSSVILELSPDEALVLIEWMGREDDIHGYPTCDKILRQVLWRLEGQLEKQLTAVLSPDYHEQLKQARARLSTSSENTGNCGQR
jgi:hypothetical protein